MAAKHVVDSVQARLTASWTNCLVIGPNESADAPSDGSPFLMSQYPVSNVARWPINERYYREEGAIRFVLHVWRGTGHDTMMTWLEELASLFRDVTFDGICCEAPTSPLINDDSEEGGYFRAAIIVPYYYNYTD